ncbi:MAG TPA: CHRD domain-containing protein [Paraburkholderia sp.]|uniref:CHRD domain-containing protein n=1 Tax=Paraburkholderia sp. TaxID=1926495 RepID=UPI002ED61268
MRRSGERDACRSHAILRTAHDSKQVPPVQTRGTGDARLTYDPDTRQVTWNLAYNDLSSPVTMAHLHVGQWEKMTNLSSG